MKMEAKKFFDEATARGYTIEATASIVRIIKSFNPGDRKTFVDCDMEYGILLDMVPGRGGSVWGTDGGSIGGQIAINNGRFQMNKSGVSARFTQQLQKFL